MDRYVMDFVATIKAAAPFSAPGNGAFIVSCHTHCEAQSDSDFTKFRIGGVSIQQAVSKWWNSEGTLPHPLPMPPPSFAPPGGRTALLSLEGILAPARKMGRGVHGRG